jgi:hypothetical protein
MSTLKVNKIIPVGGVPSGGGGGIIQVLQTAKTDTFSTSSAGFSDITGLSVAITPTSSTSKILLHYDANVGGNEIVFVRLLRGSTAIGIGDASSNRQRVTQGGQFRSGNDDKLSIFSGTFIDSPSTTSATTYKLQIYRHSGTVTVNKPFNDTDASYTGRGISTLTAMEVSA